MYAHTKTMKRMIALTLCGTLLLVVAAVGLNHLSGHTGQPGTQNPKSFWLRAQAPAGTPVYVPAAPDGLPGLIAGAITAVDPAAGTGGPVQEPAGFAAPLLGQTAFDETDFLAYHGMLSPYIHWVGRGEETLARGDDFLSTYAVLGIVRHYAQQEGVWPPQDGGSYYGLPLSLVDRYTLQMFDAEFSTSGLAEYINAETGMLEEPGGRCGQGYPNIETREDTLQFQAGTLITIECDKYADDWELGPPTHLARLLYTYEFNPQNAIPYRLVAIAEI